ncbi:hypothetical protein GCM10009554_83020 [Kribbella koreensis]|uniref:Uncharacterized protein n=1 Tax=Kribbella koreensis TaxID=57909 RepID=A0ABN1RTL3_9ACTN
MVHGEAAGCCGPVETTAPISVTINPEARVNAARTGNRVASLSSGEWHTIGFPIVNTGYVTGRLVIDAGPVPGLELDLPVHELSGLPRQDGEFRVRFGVPATVDLTLTFRALDSLGGLALHSTLHLILRSHLTPIPTP